ncbi:MAG: radical SAM protein [Clostridia bacterium]|nr:radical SAM protein [Clostridia bacterium]
MRHINIPIFIPHLGCPNQCIFCNQRYISGTEQFNIEDVDSQIETVLSGINDDACCEIAFFGGSFTGIERDLMINLLDKAQKYVNDGKVTSIRLSTRPDYINPEIINILKKYTISAIELGIQSFSDEVLSKCKRGHTVYDTIEAIRLLNEAQIDFVGQMMIGLPGSTIDDEVFCAKKICELGAVGTRIYPTIVFANTELEELKENGEYLPLNVDEAVERSAIVLDVFLKNNVNCLRIGLCDSENLHSSDTFVAGPNSPSIGELVKSKLFLYKIINKLKYCQIDDIQNKDLIIYCPQNLKSQIIGHKRKNIAEISNKYKFNRIVVKEDLKLDAFKIKIQLEGGKA